MCGVLVMTRFFINYYIHDDGYLEFKTKEERDKALKELQEFESDLNDVANKEHWLHKAVTYLKSTNGETEFEADEYEEVKP